MTDDLSRTLAVPSNAQHDTPGHPDVVPNARTPQGRFVVGGGHRGPGRPKGSPNKARLLRDQKLARRIAKRLDRAFAVIDDELESPVSSERTVGVALTLIKQAASIQEEQEKFNWLDKLTDSELATLERLKARAIRRMNLPTLRLQRVLVAPARVEEFQKPVGEFVVERLPDAFERMDAQGNRYPDSAPAEVREAAPQDTPAEPQPDAMLLDIPEAQ